MREVSKRVIEAAAEAAGLPAGRVIDMSKADNLTIPRPRLELQRLPQTYQRAGRKLGFKPGSGPGKRILKKAAYSASLQIAANILAEDAAWLEAFTLNFVRSLPRGVNDEAGNWVKIRAEQAEWTEEPAPRVGLEAIKVFNQCEQLVVLSFSGLVTLEEEQQLIEHIKIVPKPN
jgi:hypothetical protein